MSLIGLVPVPSDALVTPVSFKVKKRNLRGLLADLDAKETVVGSCLESGLLAERHGNVCRRNGRHPCRVLPSQTSSTSSTDTPKSQKRKEHVVLYIHGGWFRSHLQTTMNGYSACFQAHTICQVLLPCALFPSLLPNIPIRAYLVGFPVLLHEETIYKSNA
jgi:hypothetical protein